MRTLRSVSVLILMAAAAAIAQRSDTINQTLFNQTTQITTTGINNIGQEYHRAVVIFADNGAPFACSNNQRQGLGATATATIGAGAITAINVGAGGSGYGNATVGITGDGTGATATATITGGAITAITVNNGGSGYTTATVTIVNTWPVSMEFQASFDQVTWFPIGPSMSYFSSPATNVTGLLNAQFGNVYIPQQIEATGAYPFLRFNLVSYDHTDCKISVYYTGTLYPSNAPVISRFSDRGLMFRPFKFACNPATPSLIESNQHVIKSVVVYGLFVSSTASGTVSLWDAPLLLGGTASELFEWPVATTDRIVVPNTGAPQFLINGGDDLQIRCSVAMTLSGYAVWRYEQVP